MGVFVGGYRFFVPLSNVWVILIPVIMGIGMYSILILKFDRKIYEELKEIMLKMNIVWPEWL